MKYQNFNFKKDCLISYEASGDTVVWNAKTLRQEKMKLPEWLTVLMRWEYSRGQADKMSEIKKVIGL